CVPQVEAKSEGRIGLPAVGAHAIATVGLADGAFALLLHNKSDAPVASCKRLSPTTHIVFLISIVPTACCAARRSVSERQLRVRGVRSNGLVPGRAPRWHSRRFKARRGVADWLWLLLYQRMEWRSLPGRQVQRIRAS